MAEPVETLSFVARRLIQFEQRFAKADPARRRAASQLFSRIARSLSALSPDLLRDNLPHDPCRELALYASLLPGAAAEELGAQEAARLAEALAKASDKESLYLQFRTSEHRRLLAEELEKAAILIQALASGIHVEPAAPGSESPAGALLDPRAASVDP